MQKQKSDLESSPKNKNQMMGVFLGLLISCVPVFLGVLAVLTEQHVGRKKQGKEIFLEGGDAVLFGYGLIVFGLFPLALAMPNRKWAMIWLSLTMPLGLFLMLFRVFLN